ncbi:MAG: hypothetical protein VKL60_12145 [Sphaerospermopsis sp.]|nr:hypothetical protein [Sphaerospermopsis sp.]
MAAKSGLVIFLSLYSSDRTNFEQILYDYEQLFLRYINGAIAQPNQ